MTPAQRVSLDSQGFFTIDTDYGRPLKITGGFISDLAAHDVFKFTAPAWRSFPIHGTADETAPIEDARRFAGLSGAAFTEVCGADHRFLVPGGTDG